MDISNIELTEKESMIYDLIYTKDFHMDLLREELQKIKLTPEEIDRVAYKYVDGCFCDADQIPKEFNRRPGVVYPGLESSHMVEVITVLLEYGLNPNAIICEGEENYLEESSILYDLQFVDNGYVGADTLAVLLEHGGNPSILLNGCSMVGEANFDLTFDLLEQKDRFRYDAQVHYWMVLIGYGAKLEQGEECIKPCKGFDTALLKNHRNYYYGAIYSDRSYDGMEISFFDRRTNWEVARF